MRQSGVEIGQHEIDMTCDQVGHCRGGAPIGDAGNVYAGSTLERLADDLPHIVAVTIGELAGVLLCIVDELLNRTDGEVGAHCDE
jgi:hypothetical protein